MSDRTPYVSKRKDTQDNEKQLEVLKEQKRRKSVVNTTNKQNIESTGQPQALQDLSAFSKKVFSRESSGEIRTGSLETRNDDLDDKQIYKLIEEWQKVGNSGKTLLQEAIDKAQDINGKWTKLYMSAPSDNRDDRTIKNEDYYNKGMMESQHFAGNLATILKTYMGIEISPTISDATIYKNLYKRLEEGANLFHKNNPKPEGLIIKDEKDKIILDEDLDICLVWRDLNKNSIDRPEEFEKQNISKEELKNAREEIEHLVKKEVERQAIEQWPQLKDKKDAGEFFIEIDYKRLSGIKDDKGYIYITDNISHLESKELKIPRNTINASKSIKKTISGIYYFNSLEHAYIYAKKQIIKNNIQLKIYDALAFNPIEYFGDERKCIVEGEEIIRTKPGIYIFSNATSFAEKHYSNEEKEYNQLRYYLANARKTAPENWKWMQLDNSATASSSSSSTREMLWNPSKTSVWSIYETNS